MNFNMEENALISSISYVMFLPVYGIVGKRIREKCNNQHKDDNWHLQIVNS
jgi:hypothetical protein